MNDPLVEQIVRDVMSRLAETGSAAGQAAGAPGPRPNAAAVAPAASDLQIDQPVITGELLEQQLNGHRRLIIGPRTVLTPSARDMLKANDVAWSRGPSCELPAQRLESARGRWKVVVSRTTVALEQLLSELRTSDATWDHELSGTPAEAADLAVSLLCRKDALAVVVFSASPELVACVSNRNRQVRAAVVQDVLSIREAISSLGVNLLCLDPDARSWFALRHILKTFHAGGAPHPPTNWNEP